MTDKTCPYCGAKHGELHEKNCPIVRDLVRDDKVTSFAFGAGSDLAAEVIRDWDRTAPPVPPMPAEMGTDRTHPDSMSGITQYHLGSGSKPTNPKDMIGSSKLPLNLVPDTLLIYASMAFAEGASKYGSTNWRAAGVRASIYKAAHDRHMAKWWNGEECDTVTGVPHLASAIACLGIIADAKLCGKLTDDRPPVADMAGLIATAEAVVAHVYKLNEAKKPHHWVITDEVPA